MTEPVLVPRGNRWQPSDQQADLHDAVYGTLLDKVRQDKYPANEMLDMLEQGMWGHERAEIVAVLLEKVQKDRYPSMHLLRRLQRLVG